MNHVRQAPGDLGAGRSAADDYEIQRALIDERSVAIGVFKQRQDARAQTLSIVQRVERKRVGCRTGCVEKISLRTRGEYQEVPFIDLVLLGSDTAVVGIDRVNFR